MHVSPFYGPGFPQQNPASVLVEQQQQQQQKVANSFDPRNLEIKTRSVEQTLLPLVQQVCNMGNICKKRKSADFHFGQLQGEHNHRGTAKVRARFACRA